jgi:hypothetical protein
MPPAVDGEKPGVQLTVKVPRGVVARAEKLKKSWQRWNPGKGSTRAQVLREALDRGLSALEAEEGRTA